METPCKLILERYFTIIQKYANSIAQPSGMTPAIPSPSAAFGPVFVVHWLICCQSTLQNQLLTYIPNYCSTVGHQTCAGPLEFQPASSETLLLPPGWGGERRLPSPFMMTSFQTLELKPDHNVWQLKLRPGWYYPKPHKEDDLRWFRDLLNNLLVIVFWIIMHLCLFAQSCPTLCDPVTCWAPLSLGILQARILDCHALLQGISPTQGSIPGLFHCRQILYQLSHQGSPSMLLVLASVETKLACYCSLIYYFDHFQFASKIF